MTQEDTFTPPSLEEARQLYQLMARVKELAPWTWMDESEIFGVQQPETGALGFVSIMGMAGEHFAVAVYQGAVGLYGILDFATSVARPDPQQLLDVPQLQASFEDRDMLDKQDRDLIKQLGLKFRGANSWPMFRSYRPGYMPWFVSAAEARLLIHALAQTLEVAPRVRENPALLNAENDPADETYLVRVPRQQGDALTWTDQMLRVPPPEPTSIRITLDKEVVDQLKQMPQRQLTLEVELLSLPTGIAEGGGRPFRPYLFMLADSRSGMIVGTELLRPEPSLAEMHAQVPMQLADWLAQAGVVPEEIRARSELLLGLLSPLTDMLNIRLEETDRLPSIDAAMDSMFSMFGGL